MMTYSFLMNILHFYIRISHTFVNQMGILGVDLDKANLDDDNNFDEDDPETIIHVRLLAWRNKCEKRKVLKKR